MERNIGEILEYNGEWYQCVESQDGSCTHCDMNFEGKCPIPIKECTESGRSDKSYVIFKKLEKVGEPFTCNIHGDERLVWMQEYNLYDVNFCKRNALLMYVSDYKHKRISIEIKQNKEDMEENKLNLKPFDLQKAKAGKPVCTRDGHKARIICFDYNGETGDYPIVALVHYNKGSKCYERVLKYTYDGMFNIYGDCQHDEDLMMLPEKKEGWVNVYKGIDGITFSKHPYPSKEEAIKNAGIMSNRIDTVKICWEE